MTITASTILNTRHGDFEVRYHRSKNGIGISLSMGNIQNGDPYLRVQSSCIFSESFHSISCDCVLQLNGSLDLISANGNGVLIYLFEEGRGAGLESKMKAMNLERDMNIDTVEAFKRLGLPPDLRNYKLPAEIMKDLKMSKKVKLITNNPKKREALEKFGFQVAEIVKLRIKINEPIEKYLEMKKRKLGHDYIDFKYYERSVESKIRLELESRVESRFKTLVDTCFGGLYEYCVQTGSFAYGGGTLGKSDLDVVIVFKKDIYSESKNELLLRIKHFVNGYLKIHKETGYMPDLVFPGEFITEDLVDDSISGRGFQLDLNNHLFLPKASTEYYLENPERWFRAWLSQSAFNKFLVGNKKLFSENKVRAWSSIIKFTLWNEKSKSFTLRDIVDKLRPFGVHADYFNFMKLEEDWISRSLSMLVREGYISNSKDRYLANFDKLGRWERDIAELIRNRSIKKAKLVLNMEETLSLSNYSIAMWNKLNG